MLRQIPAYKFIIAACDYLVVMLAFFAAVVLRYGGVWSEMKEIPDLWTQVEFVAAYGIVWIAILHHFNLYKINVFLTIVEQGVAIFKSVGYGIIGLIVAAFFFKGNALVDSRLIIGYFAVFSLAGLALYRIAIFRPLYMFLAKSQIIRRKVLIVGAGKSGRMMAANLMLDTTHGFEVVGFADDTLPKGERVFESAYVLGTSKDIPRLVEEHKVDEVLVVMDNITYERLIEILDIARSTRAVTKVSSELYDIIPNKVFVEQYLGVPVIAMTKNQDNTAFLIYKRIFDIVASLIGLIVLAVPFLIIALLIKLTSKGPVFFKQIRIGKDGKPFEFYKFRSMYVNNDDSIHREFTKKLIAEAKNGAVDISKTVVSESGELTQVKKIVNDPRVTPIGRFLRKTSLDELPQLFNVLKGDMSLVGPRPCMPYEWEEYEAWHKRRLSVTPGCTGLWQVSGRSAVGFNDMVILDLYYIENMSPLMDLKLILKTLPVMLLAKGGY
ncbi:MAG: sugar transferase [Chloroherpetonaceae bacterium]|nr:sugar transferase [Chloroherpetonaceae bacterium]